MYVTADEVRVVLARDAARPEGTAAELGDDELSVHIESAQAQVDGRISGRYTVPFPDGSVPRLVVDIVRDIAAYLADLTYRQGLDYESDRDPVVLRYQQAMALLGQIAAGQIDLPVPPEPGGGGLLTARNRYPAPMFGLREFGLGVDDDGWHVR